MPSLHAAPTPAQVWTPPQVPLVEPSGMLQTAPVQQSPSAVQVPPAPTQAVTQAWLVGSQVPEQHWPSCAHVAPVGTHETQRPPKHWRLQQVSPVEQVAPRGEQLVVSTAHLYADTPSHWQEFGAQQEVSSSPVQVVPAARQDGGAAVQWSTPVAGSGTQGAPPQHWSRNWQTLAVVSADGSWAGMQQAGLFAS